MTLKNVKPSLKQIAKEKKQVQDTTECIIKNTNEKIII